MPYYICLICGEDVDVPGNIIQCPRCGNRILMKPRPPALRKVVKAI